VLIVLSAVASVATQVLAVTTGRDFVFGLIPAFDPAGSRNVSAWQTSMLWAGAAALAAVAARRGAVQARARYVVLAIVGCVWSLASMTGVLGLLSLPAVPSPGTRGAEAVAWALVGRVLVWVAATLLALASLRELARRGPLRLALDPRHLDRLRQLLVLVPVLLAGASLMSAAAAASWGARAEPWYRFLFVDFEGNLPTWYSALLLLACGAVAGAIGAASRTRPHESAAYWMVMAVGFVALSADEAAALHELLVTPLRRLVGGTPWLRYPLIVPGTAVVMVTAAVFGRFLLALPAGTRRALVTGGLVFVLGALGLETVGGWFDPELHGANVTYVLLATAEEACEMAGVSLVLMGLLRHVERAIGPLEVDWADLPRRTASRC
jgi:hypothetical protein